MFFFVFLWLLPHIYYLCVEFSCVWPFLFSICSFPSSDLNLFLWQHSASSPLPYYSRRHLCLLLSIHQNNHKDNTHRYICFYDVCSAQFSSWFWYFWFARSNIFSWKAASRYEILSNLCVYLFLFYSANRYQTIRHVRNAFNAILLTIDSYFSAHIFLPDASLLAKKRKTSLVKALMRAIRLITFFRVHFRAQIHLFIRMTCG